MLRKHISTQIECNWQSIISGEKHEEFHHVYFAKSRKDNRSNAQKPLREITGKYVPLTKKEHCSLHSFMCDYFREHGLKESDLSHSEYIRLFKQFVHKYREENKVNNTNITGKFSYYDALWKGSD